VWLFDEQEEQNFRTTYENGQSCGKKPMDWQMQRYILNPLLLYGHKFDFRVYMLVASTNPLIVYYHDGFLKLSVHIYDRNSTNKAVHLSNTEISKDVFEKAKNESWLGMNETELRKFQTWTFSRLQGYLLHTGMVKDENWIENNLRVQMKTAMVHMIRMTKRFFLKRSQSYELFGIDFVLDENLKLWLIEANSSPMMEATTEEREKLLVKMVSDHLELMFSLLRSKMKRIVTYINKLLKEIPEDYIRTNTLSALPNSNVYKTVFEQIKKNYMDPEYDVDPTNGFQKIIDENLTGSKAYGGFVADECL